MNMFLSASLSNTIGIVLMLMLLFTNRHNFFEKKSMVCLPIMSLMTIASCGADIAAYYLDGMPGKGVTLLLYTLNTWLFFANISTSFLWVVFLNRYIGIPFRPWKKWLYALILGVGVLCLVLNCFFPLIFTAENNVYARQSFYWIYVAIGGFFTLDGVVVYYTTRYKSGKMISFPVLVFVIPVLCGVAIQSLFYGISVVWVSVAIAIVGMVSSIKNEMIYIDQLTGIYNRFFLKQLKNTLSKKWAMNMSGLMVDLNDFKSINDRFGHAVGDEALIKTAEILVKGMGTYSRVIRYAGDEFVILVNSTNPAFLEQSIQNLNRGFQEFNDSGTAPYSLSASIGYHTFNVKEQTLEEFIHIIDMKMYKNKQAYHRKESDSPPSTL